jgi:hypothetical protein
VISTYTIATNQFASLFASVAASYSMSAWRTDDDTFVDFKVSNVFAYGDTAHNNYPNINNNTRQDKFAISSHAMR